MVGIVKALGLIAVGSLVSVVAKYAACEFLHFTVTKEAAFEEAKWLSSGRGIINIGAGPHRWPQSYRIAEDIEVLINVDIALDGMPNFIQLDIEQATLPFADKQFGCAFASHVIEHLDNWQFALDEACRVADYAVVVLPHPAYLAGWLVPDHKQHFSADDIQTIIELYPNVVVYY
jgi:SAM-dependent methyltransferase